MKNFHVENRAEFLKQVAALSEIMVAFIKPLPLQEWQRAVSKVDDIELFLSLCNVTSAQITKELDNYFSFDCAAQMLNNNHSFLLLIEAQELKAIWKKITVSWWSKDFFVYLKMAIYTRLPGKITIEPDLEEAANVIGEASAKEFRERLAAHEEKITNRISDVAYWEQIRRDLKTF